MQDRDVGSTTAPSRWRRYRGGGAPYEGEDAARHVREVLDEHAERLVPPFHDRHGCAPSSSPTAALTNWPKSLDVASTQSEDRPPSSSSTTTGNTTSGCATCRRQPVPSTYLDRAETRRRRRICAGMLHALALGVDWVWLADDDGRPRGRPSPRTLLSCAERHGLAEVSRWSAHRPSRPAGAPAAAWAGLAASRRGTAPGGRRLAAARVAVQRAPLFRAETIAAVGVPDIRLFVRGDEVRGPPPAGAQSPAVRHLPGHRSTCTRTAPRSSPILRPHAHPVPRRPDQRFFTYRKSGLCAVPARTALIPRSGCGSAGTSLVTWRDPAGRWKVDRSCGTPGPSRTVPEASHHDCSTDAAAQSGPSPGPQG